MNFYRLSDMSIIKAVPLFEELEAVIILPFSQETPLPPKKRKEIADRSSYAVITAGERGTLRTFLLEYQVIGNSLQNNLFQTNESHLLSETFSCAPMSAFNIDSGRLLDPSSQSQASCGVSSLQYLRDPNKLMVTTTDHRIILYSMFVECLDSILDLH
jgi:hypothetical protein